jgi:long-chain acyl-CoA synthetase
MLVHNYLERSARQRPTHICLVCGGQSLSYADVDQAANRLANGLLALGVERGFRAAVYLPNSIEAVVSIFGILKAGGVFVMINPSTKTEKLTYILNNCEASVLIASARGADNLLQIKRDVRSLLTEIIVGDLPDTFHPPEFTSYSAIQAQYPFELQKTTGTIDLDLACLIYTSGTTGDPKGVMSDHSNVDFATDSIIRYLENQQDDIVLNALPLSFDYGLYQLLMVFKFGGKLILENGFAFPAAILKQMESERVTGFPGVPTIFSLLLQMDTSTYDLSSLRYISNTAAALPPNHILQIKQRFAWARLYSMYGLTETKRTLYLPPEQLDVRPGSVGIAIPGTEVWLEGVDGQRLGADQVGELVVRGRHVMRGYWNDPVESAKRFRPGPIPGERVCYTGDLFKMDEEGYYYFISRKDDIIKSRGEKVSPIEVERVIYSLEGVTEVAVIGVPDSFLGQVIKAFVVCKNNAITEKVVLAYCRAHLEDFMVPKLIEFRDELPKTSSGKIKKSDLT